MDRTATRYPDIAAALDKTPSGQANRTFDLVARMRDLTDHDVYELTGHSISRASINQKRSGRSPIRAGDLWPLADALGVDIDVLLLAPSAAARWLVDNHPELLDNERAGEITHRPSAFPCSRPLAGRNTARLQSPVDTSRILSIPQALRR
jgi:transcriptional regulator with XRE-family HTH domain